MLLLIIHMLHNTRSGGSFRSVDVRKIGGHGRAAKLVPVAVLACVLGCSGTAPAAHEAGFPASPYATLSSDLGSLSIELRTVPDQPPTRGATDVELTVFDAVTHAPLDGLTITVVPWMPAMGHGAAPPAVSALGAGKYVAADVGLFMPGTWELRTTFADAATDSAVPTLDVR
jgi:YtkA-like